jgi:hypothetical protein
MRGFDPGQGTYKSCEYKEGMLDETKNCGPLYLSVPQGKQRIQHRWTVACSGKSKCATGLSLEAGQIDRLLARSGPATCK